MTAARGTHAAVVGECVARNKYTTGSYCPMEWEPTGPDIAEQRGYWVTWRDALCELVDTLQLDEHQALPPAVPADPWRTPETRRKVLPSLVIGPHQLKTVPLKPQRPMPDRPKKWKLGKEVPRSGA